MKGDARVQISEGSVVKIPDQPRRLLVADDDHLIASGLAGTLTSLGYEVVGPAPNGQVALELAQKDRPDIAILDIRMPHLTGVELAERLWNDLAVPTIIVSAYSDEAYLRDISARGIFAFLLKPISAESLRVALSVAWSRRKRDGEQVSRIGQLEKNLENRQLVERAKWKLVNDGGLSEPEAHSRMQRAARNGRRPLAEVAGIVLAASEHCVEALDAACKPATPAGGA